MRVFKLSKSVIVCTLVIISFLRLTVTVLGAEQESKKLELVRTYQSEEEYRSANTKLLDEKKQIVDDGEFIKFMNPETREIRKQFQKEKVKPLSEEEKQQLRHQKSIIRERLMYIIVGDHNYLMQIEYLQRFHHIEEFEYTEYPDIEITNRVLYNANGDKVANLPMDSDSLHIEASPTSQYFFTYGLDEEGGQHGLYFYSSNGTLLKKLDMDGMGKITYSQNGEFVVIFSLNDPFIWVFTKTGEVVFQGKYTDFIQDPFGTLYNLFISEDGGYLLFQTRDAIHLCTINGDMLWEKKSVYLAACHFMSSQEIIIAKTSPRIVDGSQQYTVQVLSLENGEVIDEVEDVSDDMVVNERIFLKKEGKYYEYQIH